MASKRLLMAIPAALLLVSAPAMALDLAMNYSLAVASDYVWRGVSQTDSGPAVFGTVAGSYGQFYFGTSVENVDFSGINTEYDNWAGYNIPLAGANLDIGLVRYGYVDSPSRIDTLEVKVTLSKAFEAGTMAATVMHTANYFGSNNAATYVEFTAAHPLNDKFSVSGAVGYQELAKSTDDYATWNIGVGYSLSSHLGMDLRYSNNDVNSPANINDSRVVLMVTYSL